MSKSEHPAGSEDRGPSWAPVAVAIVVAIVAVVGLFAINEDSPPPQPNAVGIARDAPTGAARPKAPADEIETIYAAPGFGSFDGSSYKTSARARELASGNNTDQLMARLAAGTEPVDTVSALGLKSKTVEADRGRIVEKLKPLVRDSDPDLRRGALSALGQSGDDGLSAMLAALSALTADAGAGQVEIDLMDAIAQMGPGMDGAVEALADRLMASNADVQRGAAHALGNMGSEGASALEQAIQQFQAQTDSAGSNGDLVAEMQKVLGQIQQVESIGGK